MIEITLIQSDIDFLSVVDLSYPDLTHDQHAEMTNLIQEILLQAKNEPEDERNIRI